MIMFSELRKLFSSKSVLISLFILMAILCVFSYNAYRSSDPLIKKYSEYISYLQGSGYSPDELCDYLKVKKSALESEVNLSPEQATKTKGEYTDTLMGDYIIVARAYKQADYIYSQFPSDRIALINNSIYNIKTENEKVISDNELIRTNENVIELYNRLIKPHFTANGDMESTYLFFDNSFWDYLMIIFVVLISVRMFTIDITNGSYQIIFSSVKGRNRLCIKQICAVIISIIAIITVSSLIQIFCSYAFFGIKSLTVPIQMYQEYEYCPYLISLGGFFAIKGFAKIIFYSSVAGVTILLTVICRKVIASISVPSIIGISAQIIMTYYYLYSVDPNANQLQKEYERYNLLRCILPNGLLNIREYYKTYDCIFLFNTTISRLTVNIIITISFTLICLTMSLVIYGKPRKR